MPNFFQQNTQPTINSKKWLAAPIIAVALWAVGTAPSQAQDFPSQPIRMVVPFSAGGPADLAARTFGKFLGDELDTAVIVENRGGGGGVIAINNVANANNDGHTLLFAASGNVTIQPLLTDPPMDIDSLLSPVAQVTTSPHGIFITAELPVNTLEELIAYAKENPGKLNFATPGVGGLGHLGIEAFRSAAGIDAEIVHYKGASAASHDLISGNVHALASSVPALQGLVDQGKLKLLGITGPSKSEALRDLPLVSDTLPDFGYSTWYGIYAPKETPAEIIEKINAALIATAQTENAFESLENQGFEIVITDPESLSKLEKEDLMKWQQVMDESGIRLNQQ